MTQAPLELGLVESLPLLHLKWALRFDVDQSPDCDCVVGIVSRAFTAEDAAPLTWPSTLGGLFLFEILMGI
jgi:hypothetical protein